MNFAIQEIAQALVLNEVAAEVLGAYEMALESHEEALVIVASDGTVRFINQPALLLAGIVHEEDVLGMPASEAGFAWHTSDGAIADRLAKHETTLCFEKDGVNYLCEFTPLYDKLGEVIGTLEIVRHDVGGSVTEGIDELTGMYESNRFYTATRRLLDYHPDEDFVLVYWDVLRFAVINNVFSSSTGDRVLKSIADTIKSFVGDKGTYGHLGGDHFAFCVPKNTLSMGWLKQHSEVTLISDTAIYTFMSTYGVYEIEDRSLSISAMCDRAALAQASVVEANVVGGNCYATYTKEMRKRAAEDQELVSQLSFALEENQIRPYFQPIYDIETGKIASAEALARWVHPEKGLIPPDRFIRMFESNGMITGLDRHIWDQAAAFLERRRAEGKPVVPISVNVSRVDFFATTLIEDLDEIVQTHNLPYDLLRVEITESAYADDPSRILEVAAKLRARGFTVLIDDFGSGYSSLNTLKDIPIDILKLDMSFLRDFERTPRAGYIIECVVSMARKLCLKVVAEGVELQSHVDFLGDVGCHLAQGFFYARPLPAESFEELLDADA